MARALIVTSLFTLTTDDGPKLCGKGSMITDETEIAAALAGHRDSVVPVELPDQPDEPVTTGAVHDGKAP